MSLAESLRQAHFDRLIDQLATRVSEHGLGLPASGPIGPAAACASEADDARTLTFGLPGIRKPIATVSVPRWLAELTAECDDLLLQSTHAKHAAHHGFVEVLKLLDGTPQFLGVLAQVPLLRVFGKRHLDVRLEFAVFKGLPNEPERS